MKRSRFLLGLMVILILFFLRYRSKNAYHILIDAGHGGEDPGTISIRGDYEKDIALSLAKKLRARLRFKNIRVSMIRQEDIYIENIDRAKMANDLGVDLFLSLHCNALENGPQVEGVQILYYPGQLNKEWAEILLEDIVERTGANNKGAIEREGLIVLNSSRMKSFIVEAGFLSNQVEADLLVDSAYQDKIIDGIVLSLEKFSGNKAWDK